MQFETLSEITGKALLVSMLFATVHVYSQQPVAPGVHALSLENVIQLAQSQSLATLYAQNVKENKYWSWRTYKSNYLPQISLSGSLPDFNRAYVPVIQQDGTTVYRYISNANSDLTLNINQSVGLTGGAFFVRSLLRRFDNFDSAHQYYYGGNPMEIGYQQSIFGYNRLFRDKRIEPLKYEESQKEYVEKLQGISVESTRHFFNVLLAQINYQIAERNSASNDTIYRIAKERYRLGKMGENELLQVELSLMTTRQAQAQALLDFKTNMKQLKNYVGIDEREPIVLTVSDSVPDFTIAEEVAIEQATKNRSTTIGFERQRIEAESLVAQARGSNGLQADFFAAYGFSNTAPSIPGMFNSPVNQQALRLGITIPIVDWGRSQSRIKTARANEEVMRNTVRQQQIVFGQEVYNQVNQFAMLQEQVKIVQWSDKIADKRYQISKKLFLNGKLDITNLNIAMQEKDQARRNYIQTLRDFWIAYYEIRRLTLYDFENMSVIVSEH